MCPLRLPSSDADPGMYGTANRKNGRPGAQVRHHVGLRLGRLPGPLLGHRLVYVAYLSDAEEHVVHRELLEQEGSVLHHREAVVLDPSVVRLHQRAARKRAPFPLGRQPVPFGPAGLEEVPLVLLHRDHEMALLGEDPFQDLPLASDGVDGDDCIGDVEEIEELRDRRYLVVLLPDRKASERYRLPFLHAVELVGRLLSSVGRRPYRLPVDMKHLHFLVEGAFRRIVLVEPVRQMLGEMAPVREDEDAGYRVVRWGSRYAEELLEVTEMELDEIGDVHRRPLPAEDGAYHHEV